MRTQPGHPPAANEDASAGGWLTIRAGTPSLPPASRSRPRRDPPVRSRWPHAPGHAGSRRGRSAAPVARPIAPADRQVGPKLGGNAVVAPPLTHLRGVVAATLGDAPGQPAGSDAPFGVLAQHMRLEHD